MSILSISHKDNFNKLDQHAQYQLRHLEQEAFLYAQLGLFGHEHLPNELTLKNLDELAQNGSLQASYYRAICEFADEKGVLSRFFFYLGQAEAQAKHVKKSDHEARRIAARVFFLLGKLHVSSHINNVWRAPYARLQDTEIGSLSYLIATGKIPLGDGLILNYQDRKLGLEYLEHAYALDPENHTHQQILRRCYGGEFDDANRGRYYTNSKKLAKLELYQRSLVLL